ncbi:MAG: TetR/AcrR family transcriptional regulator [Clostridia bacterium]|nr:TetR/AcrR family transcriptional regulator [Clostridia bacterium]
MDRRIQKTRTAIFAAFDKLIQKNAYAKISVQDIIDEANIGRSTFYEHFETKDELLRQKCTDLFEHIFSPHGTERTHDFSSATTFGQKIPHILYHLLDDKKVVKGILSSESGEIFLQYFRSYLIETIGKEKLSVQDVPEEFLQNHIAGSFIEMVRWWVNRDFKDSPENLSRYFLNVLS